MDGWMDVWMKGLIHRWVDDKYINGQMDRWMDQ